MARRKRTDIPLGMVLLRAVTGVILLAHGWTWLKEGGFDGRTVLTNVEGSLPHVSAALAWWGENVLLANPDAFAFFWRWAAFLIGVAFVFGALTRPAGILAVVFLAHAVAYGPPSLELLFLVLAMIAFACAASGAGRRVGLDALFDEHFPGWVTWARSQGSGFLS